MRSIIQLIFGLLFVIVGFYILLYQSWLNAFKILIQGGIIAGLFSLGAICIFLAVLELKA